MLELDLLTADGAGEGADRDALLGAARAAFARVGVREGHAAIELVGEARIRELNREHRGKDAPTDVLSFPVDGERIAHGDAPPGAGGAPAEFGDVVICPDHTANLVEAVVHGVLHLCGFDHENDDGEMLALQDEIVASLAPTRAGMIAIAGRPNAGKSTLVNGVVGEKVAIVSDKPQTTRREVRGVLTRPGAQLVLIDLPGSQRPRDAMTERMQRGVVRAVEDCDGALFVVNGEQKPGGGDRYLAELLRKARVPVVTAVNKIDLLGKGRTAEALVAAAEFAPGEIFPVSAKTGEGVPELVEALIAMLPDSPFLFPPREATDQPLQIRVAELIREQALPRMREELPHAIEVRVEELERVEPAGDGGAITYVTAQLWVETESQKGIVIGKGGKMIKSIGAAARPALEELLGTHVHLELRAAVRKGWRRDDALLDRLGIG